MRWSRAREGTSLLAGCSKRPSSKAAASEGPRRTLRGTLKGLNDARTKLADFFNSLLVQLAGDGVSLKAASCRKSAAFTVVLDQLLRQQLCSDCRMSVVLGMLMKTL